MESVTKSSRIALSATLAIVGGAIMLASGISSLAMFSFWNPHTGAMMYGWGGPMMAFRGEGLGWMFPFNTGL